MVCFKWFQLSVAAAVVSLSFAKPPPGYVKKPDTDEHPPKYEFGYDVRDGKGGRQGHQETRDGEFAQGEYYVDLPDGNTQTVKYYADDWGYHPLVSYSSANEHGHTRTQFALGEKAVAALKKGTSPGTDESNLLSPGSSKILTTSQRSTLNSEKNTAAGSGSTTETGDYSSGQIGDTGSKSSSSEDAAYHSPTVVTAHGGALVYGSNIGADTSANTINIAPSNRVSYTTHITHNDGASQSATSSSSYSRVQSHSSGVSGHQEIGIASDIASPLSNVIVHQSQETQKGRFESSGSSESSNGIVSSTLAPIIVQELQAFNVQNSVSTSSSQGHLSEGTSNGQNLIDGHISSTISPVVQEYQEYSKESYNEESNTVSSTASPISINVQQQGNQEHQTVQQSHESSFQNGNNYQNQPVSNLIVYHPGTLPLALPLVSNLPQTIYIQHSGGQGQKFITSSSSVSESVGQQYQESVKENVGAGGGALLNVETNAVQPNSQQGIYQVYGSSSSSSSHNEAQEVVVSSTVSPIEIQNSEVHYQGSYGVAGGNIVPTGYTLVPQLKYEEASQTSETRHSNNILAPEHAKLTSSQEQGTYVNNNYRTQTTADANSGYSTANEPQYVTLNNNENVQVISYVADTNAAIEFGAKVKSRYRGQNINLGKPNTFENQQFVKNNEVLSNEEHYSASVTPTPLPHSSLRPIVVADFSSNEEQSYETSTSSSVEISETSSEKVPAYASSLSSSDKGSLSSHIFSLNAQSQAEQSSNINSLSTFRPIVVAPLENYPLGLGETSVVSSTPSPDTNTVIITPRPEPLPVPSALVSSSEQSGQISVTLPRITPGFRRKHKNKYPSITVTAEPPQEQYISSTPTPPPPAVTERIEGDRTPPKTVVEIQKSVPLELNFGNVNNPESVPSVSSVSNYIPGSYNTQSFGTSVQYEGNVNDGNEANAGGTQLLLDTLLEDYRSGVKNQDDFDIGKAQSFLHFVHTENGGAQSVVGNQEQTASSSQTGSQYHYQQQRKQQKQQQEQEQQQEKEELKQQQLVFDGLPRGQTQQQILLQSYPTQDSVKQQNIHFANSQSLIHALQLENAATREEIRENLQVDEEELKKALESALSQIEQENTQIQIHSVTINKDEGVDAFKDSTKLQVNNEGKKAPETKSHIKTLLDNEAQVLEGNSELSSHVQIVGPEAHKLTSANPVPNQQIEDAEKQIIYGYNRYLSEIQKEINNNQQLYATINQQQQIGFNQLRQQQQQQTSNHLHVGLIPQLLESEKHENSGLNQQISEQGRQEEAADSYKEEESEEKPATLVKTQYVTVERPVIVHKPVPVEQTKYVQVEKPVPVEVTKLVEIDRPVPYPSPVAVPHPVAVPYAVPHAIEVPVHHLVAVPQYVPVKVPVKEYHPVYITGKPLPPKPSYSTVNYNIVPKANLHRGLFKHSAYGIGRYAATSGRRPHFHSSLQAHPFRLGPPQKQVRGRPLPSARHHTNLRKLCIEYGGFRPPLVPSKQIEEDPASIQEAEKKSD